MFKKFVTKLKAFGKKVEEGMVMGMDMMFQSGMY